MPKTENRKPKFGKPEPTRFLAGYNFSPGISNWWFIPGRGKVLVADGK